jgi:hypothetical protein
MPDFRWTPKRERAAVALAEGKTKSATAEEAGIDQKTLWRWLQDPEFDAEVDRLSLMVGIASRAERLRICKRLVAQRVRDDVEIHSDKDLLDWLKYAQSETGGIKLELSTLAQAFPPLAASRQD